jgi:hypothetical protein
MTPTSWPVSLDPHAENRMVIVTMTNAEIEMFLILFKTFLLFWVAQKKEA